MTGGIRFVIYRRGNDQTSIKYGTEFTYDCIEVAREEGRQAGRDEVVKEYSEMEAVAWEVTRTLATGPYDRLPRLFSTDPLEVQIGTRVIPLVPRPNTPEPIKGE
jgi:hypothetical protein